MTATSPAELSRVLIYAAHFAVLSAFGACCGGASKEIESSALLLCQYNQIGQLTPDALPDGISLQGIVRQVDVEFAAQERAAIMADLAGNPFAELGLLMTANVTAAGKAVAEASAEVTSCQVTEITIAGDGAEVLLTRTAPDFDDAVLSLDVLGELNQLGTHEEKVALVRDWYATSTSTTTDHHTLRFERNEKSWVAVLGLPEARIEEIEADLTELNVRLQEAEEARAKLALFTVEQAKYSKRNLGWGMVEPRIDITVKNGTESPVSRAYFHGVVKSPERSIPWIEEDFNYRIPGGLEPGEQARWKLTPNMFSDWGTVDVPKEAVMTVTVERLDGADGEELLSTRDAGDVPEQIETLNREADEIRGALAEQGTADAPVSLP